MSDKIVTLVGAGLAGSLLSIYLAKRGFTVQIFERRPDMRKVSISAGRSINLALSTRGIHALTEVGLFDRIKPLMIPMKGRMIHPITGDLQLQLYGKTDDEVIHSVSRSALNMSLMDAAEATGKVTIQFDQRCTGMDITKNLLTFSDESAKKIHEVFAVPVIGTDGSASAIRDTMEKLKKPEYQCSATALNYSYKELVIPPNADGSHKVFKNALHIWPRKTFMLIALPNLGGSFTCTLFLSTKGESESFESLSCIDDLRSFFTTYFPDALSIMPSLEVDFFENPTGQMVTIKALPWHYKNSLCLLGDACHAIVPFFGQGMNCAFEDCSVLNTCLEEWSGDWEMVFKKFQTLRKKNTDAIAEMAVENFIEMRDKVADPYFQLKKKVEKILEQRYPERFIPKYSMVSFRRIPYSVAIERGAIQDQILDDICTDKTNLDQIDLTQADRLVLERVAPL